MLISLKGQRVKKSLGTEDLIKKKKNFTILMIIYHLKLPSTINTE